MCVFIEYCRNKDGFVISEDKPVIGYKLVIAKKNNFFSSLIISNKNSIDYSLNQEYMAMPRNKMKKEIDTFTGKLGIGKGAFHYYFNKKDAILYYHFSSVQNQDKINLVKCKFWGETYKEDGRLKGRGSATAPTACSKYMKIIKVIK